MPAEQLLPARNDYIDFNPTITTEEDLKWRTANTEGLVNCPAAQAALFRR
jgi:hypothetical protein